MSGLVTGGCVAIGPDHYVPVLLTRQGERSALRDLPAPVRDRFTPIFVVPPVAWDFEEEAPAKSLTAHLAKVPEELSAAWGVNQAFLDLLALDDDGPLDSGDHPLDWLIERAGERGLPLTPTTSPRRTPAYQDAARRANARDGRGMCLRLQVEEWPSSIGIGTFNAYVASLGVVPAEVDLVLDCGIEVGPLAARAVTAEIASLPNPIAWRSLTILATSIPKETPPGQGVHVIPRDDWALYRQVLGSRPQRTPTFGDYAIAHPDPLLDVDPKMLNISATLRYTANADWLFSKGGLWKGNAGRSLGGAATIPAAERLQAHGSFTRGHCGFEDWVLRVLDGGGGGNPQTWRRWGTHHHLIRVSDQIASAGGASAAP